MFLFCSRPFIHLRSFSFPFSVISSNQIKPILRMSKKKLSSQSLSAKIKVSILGNGALGNPRSVIVNTDTDTYLINCGEGVQRLFYQHKIKIAKIKDVFLTRVSHSNYAGIFGMFLTYDSYFNERGCVPKLYTPPGMQTIADIYHPFIGLVKNFQYRLVGEPSMNINDHVCETLLNNVDMTIKSIPILSQSDKEDISVAYLFLTTDKPGPLNLDKCKRLKIPPGPLFAKIKSGHEIEINGSRVRPVDVLGPAEKGAAFIVLECPTVDSIESLIKNGNFNDHLQDKTLAFIIHMTPEVVFDSPVYQNWIRSFNDQTKHLVLNCSNRSEMSLIDSSLTQVKLNRVDSQIFPLLKENQISEFDFRARVITDIPTMLTINLRPEKIEKFEFLTKNSSIQEDPADNLEDVEAFREKMKEYQDLIGNSTQNVSNEFEPNVLFLGTGSSIPGKLRNTSAILLNIKPDVSGFLDCGESTFMQLCRFYGRKEYIDALKNLSFIFISHLHADHHFGTLKILQEISKLFSNDEKKKILLIAPKEIHTFLQNFNIKNVDICFQSSNNISREGDFDLSQFSDIGIQSIKTVPVPHSYQSHGIILNLHNDQVVAYSGDSQYSEVFNQDANNCLLMIHEATMDDNLREDADLKKHSTISDAISVGKNCHAKYTLLTHFSQRYPRIPPVESKEDDDLNRYIQNNVGFAFDFMNIKLNDLQRIGMIKKPLEFLFDEALQDIHEKQAKYILKRKILEESETSSLTAV